MMAAAMETRNPVTLNYVELARSQAELKRTLAPDEFPRVSDHVDTVSAMEIHLAFRINDRSRPEVSVDVRGSIAMPCQWCFEPRGLEIACHFLCQIAESESQALLWEEADLALGGPVDVDTAIARGALLDLAALVEDELLLALPDRVCQDIACERRPPVEYEVPSSEMAAQRQSETQSSPFDVLKELQVGRSDGTRAEGSDQDDRKEH